MLLVIVTVQKKEVEKRKMKVVFIFFNFILFIYLLYTFNQQNLEISDDNEFIDEENEVVLPPNQKKKKNYVPKESNLDDIDLMKGEIHKKLKEKHECSIHKTGYCYIKDDRHLVLTVIFYSF